MEKVIKNKAIELGFDVVGISDAVPISHEHTEYLKAWLGKGYAGEMGYMHRNFEKRVNPGSLMEGAKSVICAGLNYKCQNTVSENTEVVGKVADYACYEDYHKVIKEKLYLLADFIKTIAAGSFEFKVCVDSVPLAERSLAARAGLGFIAKNHMLTHPVFGQQLLLGELITNLELRPDKEISKSCAGCDACIKACPTGALSEDGLDATRCISYLSIEYKGVIPQGAAKKMGNRVFGCDECVAACPYNKDAPAAKGDFKFNKEMRQIDLKQIMAMEEDEFKMRFSNSPIFRLGLERLKRNAAICLQNSEQAKV